MADVANMRKKMKNKFEFWNVSKIFMTILRVNSGKMFDRFIPLRKALLSIKEYRFVTVSLLVCFYVTSLDAQQPENKFKSYLATLVNKKVSVDKYYGKISKIEDDYLIFSNGVYEIVIPFQSICKVTTLRDGRFKMINIYLFTHRDD